MRAEMTGFLMSVDNVCFGGNIITRCPIWAQIGDKFRTGLNEVCTLFCHSREQFVVDEMN